MALNNFNSNLVRLKEIAAGAHESPRTEFQFQLGAIKGPLPYSTPTLSLHFNSNLVRLKVAGEQGLRHLHGLFQFQLGAIKGAPGT